MDRRELRPKLPSELLGGGQTEAEQFQNEVLRPIIKLQSDLLLAHLHAKLAAMKVVFTDLDAAKQQHTLTNLFSKDQAFKRKVIGMVIGHFTLEEYQRYDPMQKEINRRIVQIVLNRCVDLLVEN